MRDEFIKIDVKPLVDFKGPNGNGCIASDKITKEGFKVGYMYRDRPSDGNPDSGWRFLAGNEDEEFMSDPNNHHVFDVNTICNYDEDIIPYINSDFGSSFIRINSDTFELDNGTKEIFIEKQ